MAVDSEDTWQRFTAGSHDALNELYKCHFVPLINYGIKLTNDKELTIECITEMFLQLWEKRHKLPEVRNVRNYLITCLKTTILQRIRSEKIRNEKEGNASALSQDYMKSYEEEITDRQTDQQIKAHLAKCLAKLTERQKELLRYRYFEDLSYDEIAERCNISKKTAYNIVFSAIKQLRSDIDDGKSSNLSFINVISFLMMYDLLN